jgi:hypothetical protein
MRSAGNVDRSSEGKGALTHTHEAQAIARQYHVVDTAAIIDDLELQLVRDVPCADVDLPGMSVAERIRE